MKKLNVTKEHFEKSNYFTKKYGKLEYVSESGKLFKTEKGKILMFKEGVFGDIGDAIDSGVRGVRKFFHGKPKFKKGDIVMLCLADFSPSSVHHGEKIEDVKWNGKCWEYKMGLDPFGNAQWYPEDRVAEDPEPDKGSEPYVPEKFPEFSKFKKFGKKFVKESCDEDFDRYYERMKKIFRYDSGIHIRMRDNEDGSETIEVTFDDRFNWNDDVVSGRIPLDEDSGLLDWITRFDEQAHRNGWEFDYDIAKDIESPIDGGANNDYLAMLTLTCKCDKEEVEDDKLFESSVGEGETGTMVKVNDLVSKAYASLYDELKKAGIDFDSASDDGFYVNDPDAQKTYFINLYVNECEEYEGSYK